jgi:hypothetical protein
VFQDISVVPKSGGGQAQAAIAGEWGAPRRRHQPVGIGWSRPRDRVGHRQQQSHRHTQRQRAQQQSTNLALQAQGKPISREAVTDNLKLAKRVLKPDSARGDGAGGRTCPTKGEEEGCGVADGGSRKAVDGAERSVAARIRLSVPHPSK